MKPRTLLLIGILTGCALLLGVSRYYVLPTYFPQWLQPSPTPTTRVRPGAVPPPSPVASQSAATLAAGAAADQLLAKLTPRQKVAQLLAVPVVLSSQATAPVATSAAYLAQELPGMITIFGERVPALQADQLARLVETAPTRPEYRQLQPELSPLQQQMLRSLIAVDHEGGSVQRLNGEGMTRLPAASQQCQLSREELKSLLDRSAKELRSVGVDVVFAPVLDLAVNHPVLRTRICSDDPNVVDVYGQYWISSLEAQGLLAVLKHYPGIGQTTVDLHQRSQVIPLNEVEHRLFLSVLRTQPKVGVMSTHVVLADQPAADQAPCTTSASCIQRLELGPGQLLYTDGLEMGGAVGLSPTTGPATAAARQVPAAQQLVNLAAQAIEAGHTVVVLGKSVSPTVTESMLTQLADRYQRNPVFRQQVDTALRKLWLVKVEHHTQRGNVRL